MDTMCGLLFIAVTLLREAGHVLRRCDRRHSGREDFFPHSPSLLHHAHHHQVKANQRPQLVHPEMLVTPYHNSSILLPFCPACPLLIFSSLTHPPWDICPVFRSSHTHHGKFVPFVLSSHTQYCFPVHTTLHAGASLPPLTSAWT